MKLNSPLFAVVTEDGTIVSGSVGWLISRSREFLEREIRDYPSIYSHLGPLRIAPVQIVPVDPAPQPAGVRRWRWTREGLRLESLDGENVLSFCHDVNGVYLLVSDANRKLISSAPDLLDTLERLWLDAKESASWSNEYADKVEAVIAAAKTQPVAMVDQSGKFHCPCGATHERGPVNGVDAYRCLRCGKCYRVRGVAELSPTGERIETTEAKL